MPVQEGSIRVLEESVEDAVVRERGTHREHASGESFRAAQQVRRDLRMVTGPHRAGAPVAREDLVEDQQRLVCVAELSRCAQILRGVDTHARRALHHGLEDHGRDLAGTLLEERRERGDRAIQSVRGRPDVMAWR